MHRPRHHRWLAVSVFLIAYSVFQAALSATVAEPKADVADELTPAPPPTPPLAAVSKPAFDKDKEGAISPTPRDEEETEVTKGGKRVLKGLAYHDYEDEAVKKNQNAEYENAVYEDILEEEDSSAVPLVYPLSPCMAPAIEQFPQPLIGPSARKHGGLIIHILVCVFTFIGLVIVCNEYFVSSVDRICKELKLAPDVAGATFMAAGSSAPKLATAVIGVFCAKDDMGVSGVIGSAVFNIMFVISVCALCVGTVSHLNWWPLCRDCFFYALSILVILYTIFNGYISWPEALFMLLMYVVYCIALLFNSTLKRWALTLNFKPTRDGQAARVTYRSQVNQPAAAAQPDGDQYTQVEGQTKETTLQNAPSNPGGTYENTEYNVEPAKTWHSNQTQDAAQSCGDTQQQVSAAPVTGGRDNDSWGTPGQPPPCQEHSPTEPQQPGQPGQPGQTGQAGQQAVPTISVPPAYYKAKEYNPETAINPLIKPVGANKLQLVYWFVAIPVHWACRYTMPDSRSRWYPVTFLMSILWISFYSYFMVWMITIIGSTLSIPDTVMGLTFVAAGVSVPDALSSLAVIKEGYGDMAVSNAVGSNVFDILVCFGLPWFIQTAIIFPGSHVYVISNDLMYSALSLFSTVIFLMVATHVNGWKLDRKYGVVLMICYLLFITFAGLYELNVFGGFRPPECLSNH